MRAHVKDLLAEVRPSAVALVDAMSFDDTELNSASAPPSRSAHRPSRARAAARPTPHPIPHHPPHTHPPLPPDARAALTRAVPVAVGRKDGAPYETLLAWARKEPMNQGAVVEGFAETYGEVMRQGREQLARNGVRVQDLKGVVQRQPQRRASKL